MINCLETVGCRASASPCYMSWDETFLERSGNNRFKSWDYSRMFFLTVCQDYYYSYANTKYLLDTGCFTL